MYKIAVQYAALRQRSAKLRQTRRAVKLSEAEGYELQPAENSTAATSSSDVEKQSDSQVADVEADKLKEDWENWALNAAQYV